jgi:P27 family predicted phage terminase small subunit
MKLLEGNPGKRAINKAEPKPQAKIPSCPRHLSKEARKEWRRISKELLQLGLLTTVDRAALAAYCQAWAHWVEAVEAMAEVDFTMVATTDKGYQHVSPWFGVANIALKQMRAFLTEFGLTPASRSRVTVAKPEEKDPYSEFLGRRKAAASG